MIATMIGTRFIGVNVEYQVSNVDPDGKKFWQVVFIHVHSGTVHNVASTINTRILDEVFCEARRH